VSQEDNLNVHLVDKFFPDHAEIPKLNENEKESCEGMISEESELYNLFCSFNTSVNLETVCPLSVTRVCIDLLI
jgi:hypothetical protein